MTHSEVGGELRHRERTVAILVELARGWGPVKRGSTIKCYYSFRTNFHMGSKRVLGKIT